MSFWAELRRRNVVRVGLAYLLVAWLIAQIVSVINEPLGLPGWFDAAVLVFLAVGFPLALLFAWAFELTAEGLKKTAHVPLEESITHLTGQKLNYVVTGLLAVAVVFIVVDDYVLEGTGGSATERGAGAASTGAAAVAEPEGPEVLPNSVAVLPLDNLSPDPDNAYIAAGLHEEILNQLTKLRDLNVIARTSVLQFAEDRPSVAEIARVLKVQSIMEGSVRYAGDRIRVTTQLIDSATGAHLWSETYDREFDDVFAIESDIAMNVANALAAEFSTEEQQRIEQRPTDSPVAYGLYLQAQNLIGVGEQAPRIHQLLDQAIRIDPDFAAAHGVKAGLYAQELINTTEGSARGWAQLEPLVRDHAEEALDLDPREGTALTALGNLASYSWDWDEAREALDRAYDLSNLPRGGPPTWFLAWSGDQLEALARAERQTDLNPLDWASHFTHGIVLNYGGEHDAAVAKFREGIELAPALPLQHSWLALTEIARGNPDAAARELAFAEELAGDNRAVILLLDIAYGYGRIGDAENARRLVDEIEAAATGGGLDIGAGGWALAHLAVGNTDEALEWLRTGADKASRQEPDTGFYSLMNLKLNYTADPVLEQPDFVEARRGLQGG